MSAQGTYRFYSVLRQTILLVNGEPLGRERAKNISFYFYDIYAYIAFLLHFNFIGANYCKRRLWAKRI